MIKSPLELGHFIQVRREGFARFSLLDMFDNELVAYERVFRPLASWLRYLGRFGGRDARVVDR